MSSLLPDGWSYNELSKSGIDILDGDRGKEYPKDHEFYEDEYCLFLSAKNVTKAGFKFRHRSFITKEKDAALRKGKLLLGDIVITTRGTVGNIAYYNESVPYTNIRINSGMAIIRNIKRQVDSIFLNQLMHSSIVSNQLELLTSGSAQPQLTIGIIKELSIPLPPLLEQQKIAAILTSVDDVIEKTQAQINKLKDLKTGMMQELLTCGVGVDGKPHTEFKDSPVGRIPKVWDVDTFDNVFTLKNGVNKGKEFFGQGVPIISYRNVYDGNGIYDHMLNSKVEMSESELSRFRVNKGDIFITRTSETLDEIGFTNVYLGNFDNVVYNGFVIRARQKRKIFDFNYCKYAFQANYMRLQMIHNSKFTTRAGISGESLNLIKIMIPSLSEQKAIGDVLSSVDSRIQALIKSKMSNLSLKKALMQDLLTGKVRVNVD